MEHGEILRIMKVMTIYILKTYREIIRSDRKLPERERVLKNETSYKQEMLLVSVSEYTCIYAEKKRRKLQHAKYLFQFMKPHFGIY